MSQRLRVVVGHQIPAARKFEAVQTEAEFERAVWPFGLLLPLLFVVGVWVQIKKFFYRVFGGSQCIPKTNFWFFDGVSESGRAVKDGSARWPALDTVYNFREGEGRNWFYRIADTLWLRYMWNAQAVRNRLKIVKRELTVAILKVAETKVGDKPITILSIAAGSGQGAIEVIKDMRRAGIRCELALVDIDTSALEHARKLAELHGVGDLVSTYEGYAASFYKMIQFRPDIIEMCGLMDYLRDTLAVALVRKIHKYLLPDGFFLTCHIHPNGESYFLRHGINWDMLYRTRDQLQDLIIRGGFLDVKLYTEPLGIHSVAVSQKV